MRNSIGIWTGLLLLFMPVGLWAADWPQWRGPNRNGTSPEKEWNWEWDRKPPKLLWEVNVGDGLNVPVVVGGKVYITGMKEEHDEVQCLDLNTGKPIWTKNVPSWKDPSVARFGGHPVATPAVSGGRLYTLHRTNVLYCWRADTGEPVWNVNMLEKYGLRSSDVIEYWTPGSSPLIMGDRLILCGKSNVVALKVESGELIWKTGGVDDKDYDGPRSYKGGSNVWTSPVPCTREGRTAILANLNRYVLCIDLETGKELWRHAEETWPGPACASDPVVADKVVVVPGYRKGEGEGRVLDLKDGHLIRRLPRLLIQDGTPLLLEGRLYVRGLWVAYESGNSGRTVASALPILVGGKLIYLSSNTLTVAEPGEDNPRVLGSVKVDSVTHPSPIFSDGRILFRTRGTSDVMRSGNNLACWDVRK